MFDIPVVGSVQGLYWGNVHRNQSCAAWLIEGVVGSNVAVSLGGKVGD